MRGYFLRNARIALEACVVEDRVDELHVARVDALVADRDGLRLCERESGLYSQPFRQAEMDVALESKARCASDEPKQQRATATPESN